MLHLDHYAGAEPQRMIVEALTRRGGKTAMGFPIYRLVWSAAVFEKVGGAWNIWDADLNIADRGGISTGEDGRPQQTRHRPDRIEIGLVEHCVYSHLDEHGWMLERWYPATFFGSPSAWSEHVVTYAENGKSVTTSIPLLGPFPQTGRYLAIAGPFPKEPPMGFLEDFISHWESRRANFPSDVEAHVKMRVDDAMRKAEKLSARVYRENADRVTDSIMSSTATNLEAGRMRQKLFEKAGFQSHIGN